MPKYEVEVCRISCGVKTFEIDAENPTDAAVMVLEQAGNHLFSESSSEYEVNYVQPKESENA